MSLLSVHLESSCDRSQAHVHATDGTLYRDVYPSRIRRITCVLCGLGRSRAPTRSSDARMFDPTHGR